MTTDKSAEDETRQMFVETAARLFAAQATREVINEFEKGTWPAALWRQVEEAGEQKAESERQGHQTTELEPIE